MLQFIKASLVLISIVSKITYKHFYFLTFPVAYLTPRYIYASTPVCTIFQGHLLAPYVLFLPLEQVMNNLLCALAMFRQYCKLLHLQTFSLPHHCPTSASICLTITAINGVPTKNKTKQTINLAHIYQNNVLNFKLASDWERKGMVVDDRQAGPNVSEPLFPSQPSLVFTENGTKM